MNAIVLVGLWKAFTMDRWRRGSPEAKGKAELVGRSCGNHHQVAGFLERS